MSLRGCYGNIKNCGQTPVVTLKCPGGMNDESIAKTKDIFFEMYEIHNTHE